MNELWRCVDCNLIHEPYGESPEGFICKCYGAIEKINDTPGNQLIKKSMEEEPDELLVRLADESKNAGLSIEDWLEFLVSLKEETTHWIRMAEKDLEKS